MTAAGATGRHHYTPTHRLIFIFTVGPVSRFPVVGRGRPTGDFELKSSSRIESEVVGQSQAKLGWSAARYGRLCIDAPPWPEPSRSESTVSTACEGGGGSGGAMRGRARETVVIGKFTTRRSQTAGFGKTSGGFLLLSRLVAHVRL